jgi:glyoxylase-like metal-dependent hydrolase (beta-lactamase superfamily II)
MNSKFNCKTTTRRQLLQSVLPAAGGAWLSQFLPGPLIAAGQAAAQQPAADPVAAFRAQLGAVPVQAQKLADNLTLLAGPGGNVVVLDGPDGKLVVDNFVAPAWPHLKEALDAISKSPVKHGVNTHWHFDHADNNAALRAAGVTIIAHENTKKRLSETHELPVLGLKFPPSPAEALPQKTFSDAYKLALNGENISLMHVAPAHTDTDIMAHFTKANVLQTGDVCFHGIYPYIDGGTGGKIDGMIAANDKILAMTDNNTKIVPGHGPLATKADVQQFRDMLVDVRKRILNLKSAGKSAQEAVAAKPFADLEAAWGKGFFNGDVFVQIVFSTL